ncbi:hypothetical protein LINPERHAP2_LOCUS32390, partial [Linum perenne]
MLPSNRVGQKSFDNGRGVLQHEAKARNVIEKAFGVLKMRWAFLRDTSWYSPHMVGFFFNAFCLLHNFIRVQG